MKPDVYAHALFRLLQKGVDSEKVVANMHHTLKERGRLALLPGIARALQRLSEREARKNRSVLTLARKADEKKARAESGAAEADITVDENIVGGWRFEDKETLQDASWKSALLSIYNRATTNA